MIQAEFVGERPDCWVAAPCRAVQVPIKQHEGHAQGVATETAVADHRGVEGHPRDQAIAVVF
jgi:hypothetical protein